MTNNKRKIATAQAYYLNACAEVSRWERIASVRPLTDRERVMYGNAQAEMILDFKALELALAKDAAGMAL